MPDISNPPGISDSADVDHDQTSNRTHDGDDLSPATLEASDSVTANGTEYVGTFATEPDLPDPSNYPVGSEATVESDPNNETSVYKLVDE
jgi:hypothetical protein